MATFVLATVGTSLLYKLRKREPAQYSGGLPDPRVALPYLTERQPLDFDSGAENNSLASLFLSKRISTGEITSPFRLAFLVSDTPEGAWVGELLRLYWKGKSHGFPVEAVDVETITGLQAEDAQRFAREGLRNLVKIASKRLQVESGNLRIINATGGYKAQVSFAGLIGQTLGVAVIYQFEQFDKCIELPPLPVDFSRDLWLEHYDLFCEMSENGCIEAEEEFLRDVDPRIQPLLDHIEEDGKHLFSLTPILELMHLGFLVRPWPLDVIEPPLSIRSIKEKWQVTGDEWGHAPDGLREALEALARFPWVNAVATIKDANTRRSRLIAKKDPELPDEIQFYFADQEKARVCAIRTTSRNDGERTWCAKTLAEWLRNQ